MATASVTARQPPRSAEAPPETAGPSSHRLQLAAVCLALALLVFWQSSGQVAADTKLDLVVSPWRFLEHAVTMWNPLVDAGTLQNQAYGYLFPMGPFFALMHLTHLPAWVIQRLWESLLVVAAFLGVVRLSRLLGVESWWPRVAAGLAYALAPRMISELGAISAELMPFAAAPWVLLPLVQGAREGSPRRAAARSGLALLFAGGVNAAATLAILPLPALWLLTRSRGSHRAALARWWVACTTLACLWWAVPLVVLGKYSIPFLNFIESSSVTTSQTSLATTLRGAEHWESYLGPGVWPAGWTFVTSGVVILATALVALAGVGGLLRRQAPHRQFLAVSVVAGLALVTLGHTGAIHPLAAGWWRQSLDGTLDAFRNVHKFDPVLRLPLAIGVGHAVVAVGDRLAAGDGATVAGERRQGRLLQVVAIVASVWVGVLAAGPAFANTVVAAPRTTVDPSWWSATAAWLAAHSNGGRAIVVPGAASPAYLWGAPSDDALQPVATTPWTVRDSIPLAQPSYVRLLDTVETRLAAGRADPTLAAVLARSGISDVVVRNDLDTTVSDATPLRFVHTTLDDSPGIEQVQTLGPSVTFDRPGTLSDLGATTPDGAITIYQNTLWDGMAELTPASDVVEANGLSDQLPDLTAAGLPPHRPVVFGQPPAALRAADPAPLTVLDDGAREREFGFGAIDDYSATFLRGQRYDDARSTHDYLPAPAPPLSEYVASGIRSVTASSSGADAGAFVNRSAANSPWAAVDGDGATAWRVGSLAGSVGQWLQVDLDQATSAATIDVRFAGEGKDVPDQVAVTTAAGREVEAVASDTGSQPLALPAGSTDFVRITLLRMADGSAGLHAGITAVTVPGVAPTRSLAVPSAGSTDPGRLLFTVEAGARSECLTVGGQAACDPAWQQSGEEDQSLDRTFKLPSAGSYRLHTVALARPGQALDELLDGGDPLRAIASSVDSHDPRQRPGAAVDGDPTTGWVASPHDPSPALQLSTRRPARLTGLVISALSGAPVTAPTRVLITAGHDHFVRRLSPTGVIDFGRTVTARTLTIEVLHSSLLTSVDSVTGATELLPVGIGEVRLLGPAVPVVKSPTHLATACGAGPTVTVDGGATPTRLFGPTSAALSGRPMRALPCGRTAVTAASPQLSAGQHRVAETASAAALPSQVVLARSGVAPLSRIRPDAGISVRPLQWGDTDRTLLVTTTSASVLTVHENANTGWQATYAGQTLHPVTVDGWQQGWIVPANAHGIVHLAFLPQRTVTVGLVVGGVAAALLLPLAFIRRRRPDLSSPSVDARWPLPLVAVVVAGSALLLGALPGLAVAAFLVALDRWWAIRGWPRWRPAAVVISLALVAVLVAAAPVTSGHPLADSAGVQLLCLFALTLALLDALAGRRRQGDETS